MSARRNIPQHTMRAIIYCPLDKCWQLKLMLIDLRCHCVVINTPNCSARFFVSLFLKLIPFFLLGNSLGRPRILGDKRTLLGKQFWKGNENAAFRGKRELLFVVKKTEGFAHHFEALTFRLKGKKKLKRDSTWKVFWHSIFNGSASSGEKTKTQWFLNSPQTERSLQKFFSVKCPQSDRNLRTLNQKQFSLLLHVSY